VAGHLPGAGRSAAPFHQVWSEAVPLNGHDRFRGRVRQWRWRISTTGTAKRLGRWLWVGKDGVAADPAPARASS
jgi:hypothetical protein